MAVRDGGKKCLHCLILVFVLFIIRITIFVLIIILAILFIMISYNYLHCLIEARG